MAFFHKRTQREKLILALRGKLPADFEWNFKQFYKKLDIPETPEQEKHCGFAGCAVGLAFHLGMLNDLDYEELGKEIGLSHQEAENIFISLWRYNASDWNPAGGA